jgi:hypothetical protein
MIEPELFGWSWKEGRVMTPGMRSGFKTGGVVEQTGWMKLMEQLNRARANDGD